ncbi:MAG: hypothetical protein CMO55_18075 [Verrucomicrobiales bacterium]|nr:hypothetical protein [Verrucomicrobiales bacterium]
MALSTHPGGAADKAGMIHEALWGAYALLQVVDGHADSIRIETPGDDGAEFQLVYHDRVEHWQAKRQVTGQETWTFQKLESEGVLQFFFEKFRVGDKSVFASISDAPTLRILTENAFAVDSLSEFKTHFLDKTRTKQFSDLTSHLGASSEDETFAFLRSVRVEGGREQTLETWITSYCGVIFTGLGQATFGQLKSIFIESVHESLTASIILEKLKTLGISRRHFDQNENAKITQLTDSYIAGQRAKLISGNLVERDISKKIISKLSSAAEPCDIILSGPAGTGKSGSLLEIVQALREEAIPTLAFRLDRIPPSLTTSQLGKSLGLSESPAPVLAHAHPAVPTVLIIDQVDCVSSTSGRNPEFFDTVAALREEVIGLRRKFRVHFVISCRKFDLDHDYRLKQLCSKDCKPDEIGNFSEEEAQKIVSEAGGTYAQLTEHQKTMLRLPQNLSMYVAAQLFTSTNRFTTPKDLCDEYWIAKRREVEQHSSDYGKNWTEAMGLIADTMSERQELSLPLTVLDGFSQEFLNALFSSGVLTRDAARFGFVHETFFDYCFARTRPEGGRQFVKFLEHEHQHLFRRAQLRQVFAFLRDEDFEHYLSDVSKVLKSGKIRPHLKILIVELLCSHPSPNFREFEILLPWIQKSLVLRRTEDLLNAKQKPPVKLLLIRTLSQVWARILGTKYESNAKLAARIWDRFAFSNTLFPIADSLGIFETWLQSEDPWFHDVAINFFRFQNQSQAERIAELLEPLVNDKTWKYRLQWLFNGGELSKNRRYFELFIAYYSESSDLIDNTEDQWLRLYGLAEEEPSWLAEFAALYLRKRISRLNPDDKTHSSREILGNGIRSEYLLESAKRNPSSFLQFVLPALIDAVSTLANDPTEAYLGPDPVWSYRIRGDYGTVAEAYIQGCEIAFSNIGRNSPEDLRPFVEQLRILPSHTANQLLLSIFLSNPDEFANQAISTLNSDHRRFWAGFSGNSFWTAQQVIENCSPICTDELFRSLELNILNFEIPFENTKDGFRRKGDVAYSLASCLCTNRTTSRMKLKLREWTDKYSSPSTEPEGIRSYTVGSPIAEKNAKKMSDQQWLRAIAKYCSEERSYDPVHPEKGGARELARMLQTFAAQEPYRFAALALQFPEGTNHCYFAYVLDGLQKAEIAFTHKLQVARLVFQIDSKDCFRACLGMLGTSIDEKLPEDAIEYIKFAAAHRDPNTELWNDEVPYYGRDILSCGINSVRGYASETIKALIFSDPAYIEDFEDTILHLITDNNVSVRAVAASILRAIAVTQTDEALDRFEILVHADDRLLGTPYLDDFIRAGLSEHTLFFIPIIKRMLHSEHESVRESGGRLASLACLYSKYADGIASLALRHDEKTKLGVCEVASSNYLNPECREWCVMALKKLFNDKDCEIRKKSAHCFWHLLRNPDISLAKFDDLIDVFVDSSAFETDPTFLLHAIEENLHRIPSKTLEICKKFVRKLGKKTKDSSSGIAADERTIGKLAFSTYAQMSESVLQIEALDLIDRMSLEGFYSVSKEFSELDR